MKDRSFTTIYYEKCCREVKTQNAYKSRTKGVCKNPKAPFGYTAHNMEQLFRRGGKVAKTARNTEKPARGWEIIAKMAHSGKEPPADPLECALYHMFRRIYELHQRGEITKEDGAYLKKRVLDFDSLDEPGRLHLIDLFIESWSRDGPQKYKAEIKAVSAIHTGEKPVVRKQNNILRRELCPIAKELCREDCGLFDCQRSQCAALSIVEALEELKEGLCNE